MCVLYARPAEVHELKQYVAAPPGVEKYRMDGQKFSYERF
jgi:hypothetical protein